MGKSGKDISIKKPGALTDACKIVTAMARGVIATPFDVKPFQVSFDETAEEASDEPHYTWECATTYSKEDEQTLLNPISGEYSLELVGSRELLTARLGLMIHDRDASNAGSVPYYSIVRLSATGKNQDWFQTNLPDAEASLPHWAAKIRKHTTRLIPRAIALEGLDSDSDDSECDMMEEDGSQRQVHESRYRIWGLASSPGGSVTAVLVSRYSTQHPERRALCKVMFSRGEQALRNGAVPLTTEGRVWEWMYGNGPEVAGTTAESKTSPELHNSPLREQFRGVASRQQHCVFCDAGLQMMGGDEAECDNGHMFGT